MSCWRNPVPKNFPTTLVRLSPGFIFQPFMFAVDLGGVEDDMFRRATGLLLEEAPRQGQDRVKTYPAILMTGTGIQMNLYSPGTGSGGTSIVKS